MRTAQDFQRSYGVHPFDLTPARFVEYTGVDQEVARRIGLFPEETCSPAASISQTEEAPEPCAIRNFCTGQYRIDTFCLPPASPLGSLEQQAATALDQGFVTWGQLQQWFDELPESRMPRGEATTGTDAELQKPKTFVTGAYARLTGVFCNSAIKAAERDHEMVIQNLQQNKKDFKALVKNLFRRSGIVLTRIDDAHNGLITISEFEKHFDDEAVRAFFESLEMNASDAWTLFASLDADGDGAISLEEFIDRCVQLHGQVKLRSEIQKVFDLQKVMQSSKSAQASATVRSRAAAGDLQYLIAKTKSAKSEDSDPHLTV
eukprot:s2192_g9.t1